MGLVSYGENRKFCHRCKSLAHKSKFPSLICRKCHAVEQEQKRSLKARRTIETACRDLSKAIASSDNSRRDIPVIVEEFKRQVGGAHVLAQMLVQDFQRVRGDNLTQEEKEEFNFKEQVIQRYHQMLLKSIHENDQSKATDLSQMTEEDLMTIIKSAALDMLNDDAYFRKQIAVEALKDNPDLILELFPEEIINGQSGDTSGP